MKDRRKESYKTVFKLLKENAKINSPRYLIHDFEVAAISAFSEVFPDSKLHGCFFHFTKMIRSNMQKHYPASMKKSLNFKIFISLFKALSFVPEDEVVNYYLKIIQSENYQKYININPKFIEYFDKNFIGTKNKPRFPIQLWNNFDMINLSKFFFNHSIYSYCYNFFIDFPITNNYAESHNRIINQNCLTSHPTMTNFIAIIKQLLNFGDYDLLTGYIPFKKTESVKKNRSLKELMKNFRTFDELEYLKKVSTIFRKYIITQ